MMPFNLTVFVAATLVVRTIPDPSPEAGPRGRP
jgi:hypothetical protein